MVNPLIFELTMFESFRSHHLQALTPLCKLPRIVMRAPNWPVAALEDRALLIASVTVGQQQAVRFWSAAGATPVGIPAN